MRNFKSPKSSIELRYTKDKVERLFFAGILMILSGLAFIGIKLYEPRIRDTTDLYFCKGTFEGYTKEKAGRGTSLTFGLSEYRPRFKIKADFFGILDDKQLDELETGDLVTVGIARRDSNALKTSGSWIFIYSMSSETAVVLDSERAISKHNSLLMWVISVAFVGLGCMSIYFSRKGRQRLKLESTP